MLELRLHCDDRLHYNGFDFFPDLSSGFCDTWTSFLNRWLRHDALQAVIQSKLVVIIAKIIVFLIQTIVRQVRVGVVEVFRRVILL